MNAKRKDSNNGLMENCGTECGSLPKNVGDGERWISMFGSGVLVAAGLMRGSPLFVTAGVGLAARALTGYCPLYQALEPQRESLMSPNQPKMSVAD